MDFVEWCIVVGNVPANVCDDYCIKWASRHGYYEMVKLLLKHGASAESYCRKSLRWAVKNQHTKIVQILLHHGARYDIGILSDACAGSLTILEMLEPIVVIMTSGCWTGLCKSGHTEYIVKYVEETCLRKTRSEYANQYSTLISRYHYRGYLSYSKYKHTYKYYTKVDYEFLIKQSINRGRDYLCIINKILKSHIDQDNRIKIAEVACKLYDTDILDIVAHGPINFIELACRVGNVDSLKYLFKIGKTIMTPDECITNPYKSSRLGEVFDIILINTRD